MSYAKIAKQVDIAMRHSDKPCIGDMCDDMHTCKRHERTIDIVGRFQRRFGQGKTPQVPAGIFRSTC